MAKRKLKTAILAVQGGVCALTDTELPADLALIDTDRIVPKLDGGIYTPTNTRIVEPRAHMQRHGTLRERPATLDELKSAFDDRVQTMKLLLKINNQLLAYQRRTDAMNPETEQFLQQQMAPINKRLSAIDTKLESMLKRMDDPIVKVALAVPGLGPISIAALTVYVDIEKAATPSALWQYAGLDRPSHERYERNAAQQARRAARGPAFYGSDDAVPTGWGGNKVLRTVLWNTANSMMKNRLCPYRDVYDATKHRLSVSEKITKSRNTAGHMVEVAWKDAKPSHRHGAALRAIMKHLLADYWFVARTLRGLSTVPLYVQEKLGHTHIVSPRERGWTF